MQKLNREYSPLVSIGMPVFNGEKYIRLAIDSLLAQKYQNFELIISDNASTDQTSAICQGYAAKDSRIHFIKNDSNIGAVKNFSKTLDLSKGEYFMWAAHDDLWAPNFIDKCLKCLEKNSEAVLSYSALKFIDENGFTLKMSYGKNDNPNLRNKNVSGRVKTLIKRNGWYGIYGLIRSDILKRVFFSMIEKRGDAYGFDVILVIELALLGPFCKVSEVLFFYRQINRSELERHNSTKAIVKDTTLYRPYTSLAFEILYSIFNSSQLDRDLKQRLIADVIKIFSTDKAWNFRFNQYNELNLYGINIRDVLKEFSEKIPFDPRIILPMISYGVKQKGSTGLRCAILELNHYHEQIIPTFIYLLNGLGIDVDVFIPDSPVKNISVFEVVKNLNFSLCETNNAIFDFYEKSFCFSNYDFIIINSLLEASDWFKRFSSIYIPMIAIIHDEVNMIGESLSSLDIKDFFAVNNRIPVVMGAHSKANLIYKYNLTKCSWAMPIYLNDTLPMKKIYENKMVSFAVTGYFDIRRNYDSLIEAIERLLSIGMDNFIIKIIGYSETKQGVAFKKKIKQKGFSKFFAFTQGRIDYSDFYSKILECDFILPLLDTTNCLYLRYLTDKYTSALGLVFGLGIVPVCHRKLSEIYGISHCSITYEDGKLFDSILDALKCDSATLIKYRNSLTGKQQLLLSESMNNLKDIITNEFKFNLNNALVNNEHKDGITKHFSFYDPFDLLKKEKEKKVKYRVFYKIIARLNRRWMFFKKYWIKAVEFFVFRRN